MAFRFPATTPAGDPNVPGVNHAHAASGSWLTIRGVEALNCLASPFTIPCACASMSPIEVVTAAFIAEFSGKPLASRHLGHYLSGGGVDFTEDVGAFIKGDSGVRSLLAGEMATAPRGHFKVNQFDYANQDFRFAFGAIDRLDYRVDKPAGVVHVWFVDRYEWHPVYPGIYTFKSGDAARITNCVHAALVELKSSGASDFWMVGYKAIPLTTVTAGGASGGGGSTR